MHVASESRWTPKACCSAPAMNGCSRSCCCLPAPTPRFRWMRCRGRSGVTTNRVCHRAYRRAGVPGTTTVPPSRRPTSPPTANGPRAIFPCCVTSRSTTATNPTWETGSRLERRSGAMSARCWTGFAHRVSNRRSGLLRSSPMGDRDCFVNTPNGSCAAPTASPCRRIGSASGGGAWARGIASTERIRVPAGSWKPCFAH